MFISSTFLEINYGIDSKIAHFFVDRTPPANNYYWQGKLLYLRPAPGYLFIPLIVDLLHRLGIDKQQLLSESFVATMEHVGHISALEEMKQITNTEAIFKSAKLVENQCINKNWYNNLLDYFNCKMPNFFTPLSVFIKALQRGDLFLFSVCALAFPAELSEKIAAQWFALISTLLLLDDAEDLENDKETGDENAFLESGLTAEGLKRIDDLVTGNLQIIYALNPSIALQLEKQYKQQMSQLRLLNIDSNV